MIVRVSRRAQLEIARIDEWWRTNRPSAGSLFAEELAGAIALLEIAPEVGRFFARRERGDVRRFLLPECQYHLYYRRSPGEDIVTIVSVWGAVRGRGPSL
jgi:hypothetical protein